MLFQPHCSCVCGVVQVFYLCFACPSHRGESWKSHFLAVVVLGKDLVLLSMHVVSCNLVVSHPEFFIFVGLLWWRWCHSHITPGCTCSLFLMCGEMYLFSLCILTWICLWDIWWLQTLSGPQCSFHWWFPPCVLFLGFVDWIFLVYGPISLMLLLLIREYLSWNFPPSSIFKFLGSHSWLIFW